MYPFDFHPTLRIAYIVSVCFNCQCTHTYIPLRVSPHSPPYNRPEQCPRPPLPAGFPERSTLACYICGALYAGRSGLNKHLKKHTGQTTCHLCRQVFSAMYALRRHLRDMHGLLPDDVDALTGKGSAGRLPVGDGFNDGTMDAT